MSLPNFDKVIAHMMVRYGGVGNLLIDSTSTYDPTTGSYAASTTSYPVNILLMDYTMQKNGASEMGGTLILAGDKQCYVQPLNKSSPNLAMPVLQPNRDRVQVNTDIWKIVSLKELNPSATSNNSVVFELHLRK